MEERVKIIILKVFNLTEQEYRGDLSNRDISDWDSLKHMELVFEVEQEFKIELSADDIVSIYSINSLIDVLRQKV